MKIRIIFKIVQNPHQTPPNVVVLSTDPKIDPKPKNLQNYFLRNSELNFKKSFILIWVMGFWAFWVFGFSVFQFSQFQEMPATLYTSRIPQTTTSNNSEIFRGSKTLQKLFRVPFRNASNIFIRPATRQRHYF